MQTAYLSLLLLFSFPVLMQAQDGNSGESLPFLDYWPIVLLPIFVIVLYRFWKKRKK
ncbi:hypothetical protein SAMN05192553_101862 [Cyclobacterium xiamenense]|uniref:PEP-CTERM protein-sorting domain-containing protein n=1 Tax=Cyclobacterium xiamenense TaxID=1297121 RepID=A0A1H6UJ03_9BACT|nr:hypothetical protein SAMN05192553_101862 [Cyclobacterium xiamenense]